MNTHSPRDCVMFNGRAHFDRCQSAAGFFNNQAMWALTACVFLPTFLATGAYAEQSKKKAPSATVKSTSDEKNAKQAPQVRQIALFHAGLNAIHSYRVPGIVKTPSGVLFAYCEGRRNDHSDWGEIEIHSRRSVDGGATWEAPRQVAHFGKRFEGNPTKRRGGETEQTAHSPTAVITAEGRILILYCLNYSRCFAIESPDDGISFSAPREITNTFDRFRPEVPWSSIATGPGHGICTSEGRLIVPVWLAYGHTGALRPSVVSTIYSDDNGQSWRNGNVAITNEGKVQNPAEAAIAQLADGSIILNARSESRVGRRITTKSADGDRGWSQPRFDPDLAEPICQGSLLTLSDGRLVFVNPRWLRTTVAGTEIPGARAERKNLTVHVSSDGGSSWAIKKTLEENESAYSDLVELNDREIGVLYERGKQIIFATIDKSWLEGPAEDSIAVDQDKKSLPAEKP
jgi:sialidase-1